MVLYGGVCLSSHIESTDLVLEITNTQVLLAGFTLLVWLLDQKGGAAPSGVPLSFKEERACIDSFTSCARGEQERMNLKANARHLCDSTLTVFYLTKHNWRTYEEILSFPLPFLKHVWVYGEYF